MRYMGLNPGAEAGHGFRAGVPDKLPGLHQLSTLGDPGFDQADFVAGTGDSAATCSWRYPLSTSIRKYRYVRLAGVTVSPTGQASDSVAPNLSRY